MEDPEITELRKRAIKILTEEIDDCKKYLKEIEPDQSKNKVYINISKTVARLESIIEYHQNKINYA